MHARKGMDRAVGDAQLADEELPGTRRRLPMVMVPQTHWHRSRSGSTRSMSSVPTFASFFPTCMIMVEVSITGARGDEPRQFASHLALLRDALSFERAAFVGESIGAHRSSSC